jgi:hypothetical protein
VLVGDVEKAVRRCVMDGMKKPGLYNGEADHPKTWFQHQHGSGVYGMDGYYHDFCMGTGLSLVGYSEHGHRTACSRLEVIASRITGGEAG